jgi:hypothetical protein
VTIKVCTIYEFDDLEGFINCGLGVKAHEVIEALNGDDREKVSSALTDGLPIGEIETKTQHIVERVLSNRNKTYTLDITYESPIFTIQMIHSETIYESQDKRERK